MSRQNFYYLILLMVGGWSLVSCSTSPATPTPDLVATEVAVQKTAAAILTTEASPPAAIVAATDTPPPTATSTLAPPTDTPTPPPTVTSTLAPPTDTPTLPPPPQRKSVPPDGGDRRDEFFGEIVLPEGAEVWEDGSNRRVTLRGNIFFQLKVRDPHKGSYDGAGVKEVQFDIQDSNGSVYKRTERQSGYCVFGGGEPDCNVRRFDDGWGNGHEMNENVEYTAEMRILLESGDELNWRWRFFVAR